MYMCRIAYVQLLTLSEWSLSLLRATISLLNLVDSILVDFIGVTNSFSSAMDVVRDKEKERIKIELLAGSCHSVLQSDRIWSYLIPSC